MASYEKIATWLGMSKSEESSPNSYEANLPYVHSAPCIRSCPAPARQTTSISFGGFSGKSTPTSPTSSDPRKPSAPRAHILAKITTSLAQKQQNGTFEMPTHDITKRPRDVADNIEAIAAAVQTAANGNLTAPIPAIFKPKLWYVLEALHAYQRVSEALVHQLQVTEKEVEALRGKVSNLEARSSMLEDDAEAMEESKDKVIKAHDARIAELVAKVSVLKAHAAATEEEQEKTFEENKAQIAQLKDSAKDDAEAMEERNNIIKLREARIAELEDKFSKLERNAEVTEEEQEKTTKENESRIAQLEHNAVMIENERVKIMQGLAEQGASINDWAAGSHGLEQAFAWRERAHAHRFEQQAEAYRRRSRQGAAELTTLMEETSRELLFMVTGRVAGSDSS